jgi:hypothetical protein
MLWVTGFDICRTCVVHRQRVDGAAFEVTPTNGVKENGLFLTLIIYIIAGFSRHAYFLTTFHGMVDFLGLGNFSQYSSSDNSQTKFDIRVFRTQKLC